MELSKVSQTACLSVRQPLLARPGLILGFETRNQLEERGGKISIAAHCVCRFATVRTNDDALTMGLCFVIRTIMRLILLRDQSVGVFWSICTSCSWPMKQIHHRSKKRLIFLGINGCVAGPSRRRTEPSSPSSHPLKLMALEPAAASSASFLLPQVICARECFYVYWIPSLYQYSTRK